MDTLEKRRAQVEEQFNLLEKQRQEHLDKVKEIETELARLQGEWRLLGELQTENVSKEANKLDIKEKDHAKTT